MNLAAPVSDVSCARGRAEDKWESSSQAGLNMLANLSMGSNDWAGDQCDMTLVRGFSSQGVEFQQCCSGSRVSALNKMIIHTRVTINNTHRTPE